MKNRMRFGIAGCGDIARFTALGCLCNPRLEAAVCVDTDERRAGAFARRFRIRKYETDYERMLDAGGIDAVYLAVPHFLHHPFMKAAVERGLPVLCEKPITPAPAEAADIVERAEEAGVKIGVNYQYMYDRGIYALISAAREGALGKIHYCRCHIPWHRENSYFETSPWHADTMKSGGGTLITQGSHFLDAALAVFPSSPAGVFGLSRRMRFTDTNVEDLFTGVVEMETGGLLEITSSMVCTPQRPAVIEVCGSEGTGIYRDAPAGKLRFLGVRPSRRSPPVPGLHALFRSLEAFRRWIMLDEPYLTPARRAMEVLTVVDALYRSAESGKRIGIKQGGDQ